MTESPLAMPATRSTRRIEVDAKVGRLRALAERQELPAIALTTTDGVAWLTGGLTNRIEPGNPASPLWLVVTGTSVVGLTTNVELPRLADEAGLGELGFELDEIAWFKADDFARRAAEIAGVPADQIGGLGQEVGEELVAMRLPLVEPEQARLAALGVDAARALERALAAWSPGELDTEIQARVAEALEQVGAFGACLIVGGDERVERFRHPLAHGVAVDRLVMAVVVAERHGLHVAATRFASAGPLPSSVRRSHDAAAAVELRTLGACVAGATFGDVLTELDRAYATEGRPGGWSEHYQGGPIGYRQREFEIVPTDVESRWFTTPIEPGTAVAWNPSFAGGGKCEDTYLVGSDGLVRLTETNDWPNEADRPAILDIETGGAA